MLAESSCLMLFDDAQRAAVCRILAGELGQAVQLEDVRPASPAGHRGVSRVTVGGAPNTWIVTTSRMRSGFDPADPTHAQPWGFFSELVGAAFVSGLEGEPPLSPRCVGAAPDIGVIVLEDLGSGHDLADLLLGSDREAAEQGMQDFGRALGRLHARAAGREAEYDQLWRNVVPDPPRPPLAAWQLPASVQALREVTAQLGLATGVSVEADLRTLAATPDESVLRTYVHGDPCPDNVRPGGGGRLLDFQGGGFGSALLDGVYARMPSS